MPHSWFELTSCGTPLPNLRVLKHALRYIVGNERGLLDMVEVNMSKRPTTHLHGTLNVLFSRWNPTKNRPWHEDSTIRQHTC